MTSYDKTKNWAGVRLPEEGSLEFGGWIMLAVGTAAGERLPSGHHHPP